MAEHLDDKRTGHNTGHAGGGLSLTSRMLPRPKMPTAKDQARSIHTRTRLQILMDDWDVPLKDWLELHIDTERLENWGVPDTASNPLADMSRQLSTPGLYGKTPEVRHTDGDSSEVLIGPEGHLHKAGHWTKMQHVQFLAIGAGDYVVRIDAPKSAGRLTMRLVSPGDVHAVGNSDLPDEPLQFWELRIRWWELMKKHTYVWETYEITDPKNPAYRIVEAKSDGSLGMDLSNQFLATEDNPDGDFTGDKYPYRYGDGEAFIPFTIYRAADTGLMWNTFHKRGVHRGTLNSALYWTYASYCAQACTGSFIIVAGLTPIAGTKVHRALVRDDDSRTTSIRSGNQGVRTLTLTPGAIAYHSFDDSDRQPFVKEIGPGANLPEVARFAELYEMKMAVRWGLNPADIQRQAANPSSGAALFIGNASKRTFSAQVTPMFSKADKSTLRKSAALLNRSGFPDTGSIPETGYSITYAPIPKSPAEQKEARDQTQWEVDQGYLSQTSAYIRLHPGASSEDARLAIVQAEIEKLRINKMIDDLAESEGLTAPAVPRLPSPTPPE